MTRNRARWLSAAVVGLFLVLASSTLAWSQKYRALAAQRASAEQLADIGERLTSLITAELARLDPRGAYAKVGNGFAGHRYPWRANGADLNLDPLLDDAAVLDGLRRVLAEPGVSGVYGPVATLNGNDMLILSRASEGANPGLKARAGVVVPVIELMQASGLVEFAQRGHHVRISSTDHPDIAVFRSHVRTMSEPITTRVAVPGGAWLLTSEPLAGWTSLDETWPLVVIGLLLAFAVGASVFVLAEKPEALRAEIDTLEERLRHVHEDLQHSLRLKAQIESRLDTVASLDAESGLTNRRAFQQLLADELKTLRERVGGLSIVVVRLANLKQVAAVVGARRFFAGLADILDGLRHDFRFRPFEARLSDLELALCLPRETDPGELEKLAEELCERFGGGIEADREGFDLQPAIGIAIAEDGYRYADELIDGALLAASEADVRNDRKWVIYDPEIRESRTSMLQLEAQIGEAIEQQQFRLYCQPIVRTVDRALTGFETLLRWQHPVEGLLTPGRFLSIAEGSRHMRRLSRWCTREVVRLAGEWLNLREEPFYLSVNLTASDLERTEFVAEFAQHRAHHELPTDRVRVEVTEREIIKDLGTIARATAELEEQGVRVLLDDFGTGFSSLTHLRTFHFHTVKIDRSFIGSMVDDPKDRALVNAMVDLVHDLGMECVAEGVETEEQLKILKKIGCDYCQGYLFGRPTAPEDVPDVVARFPVPDRLSAAAS